MQLATCKSYSKSKTEYDGRATCVRIGALTLWFSYETLIAFQVDGSKLVCRQNEWGPTTGKHLNQICPVGVRVPGEEFERLWGMITDPVWAMRIEN